MLGTGLSDVSHQNEQWLWLHRTDIPDEALLAGRIEALYLNWTQPSTTEINGKMTMLQMFSHHGITIEDAQGVFPVTRGSVIVTTRKVE